MDMVLPKKYVNLNSIDSVKEFVNIVSQYPFEVDLGSGRYIIDGKSIMGIYSLDLSKPIEITVNASLSESEGFFKAIDKFIVRN